MLTYLPALLHASQALLQGLSEDPSAWGVSSAFLACENEIETAMVAWCGVAGQFFSKQSTSRGWRKNTYPNPSHTPSRARPSSFSADDHSPHFPLRISEKSKEDKTEIQKYNVRARKSMEQIPEDKILRKLSVRDLAIQPTQRVMRYAMLYKG